MCSKQLILIFVGVCVVLADVPLRIQHFDQFLWAIHFAADGNVWIGTSNLEETNSSLNKYTPTFSLLQSWPISYAAYGLAISSANGDLFYTNPENSVVVLLSGKNGSQLAIHPVSDAIDIAIDANNTNLYVAQQSGAVSKLTVNGELIATYSLQQSPPYCGGVVLDAADNIYASAIGAVVQFDNNGRIISVLKAAVGYGSGLVFARNGGLIVVDEMSYALQIDVRTAAVQHMYDSSTIAMSAPRTVAIEPATGNVVIIDIDYNRAFVFAQYPFCSTGDATGYVDLTQLSPDGSDLTGTDVDRRYLYYWNVCGRVTDPYCTRFAADAAVCALDIPVTNGFAIARSSPPWVWTPLVNQSSGHVTGLLGRATNGTSCGRYQLSSQVIVRLICAAQQDPTFIMDDSAVHPSSPLCSYVLTLSTPIACNISRSTLV